MLKIMPSDKLIMGNIDPHPNSRGSIESITAAHSTFRECNLYP